MGQGSVSSRLPAAASPTARDSGRANTTVWRRASRQTCSSGRIPTRHRFVGRDAIPPRRTFGYRRKVERFELRRNWPGALLAAAALVLIPWAIALGQTLPSRHVADHWDAAWTGFDVILALTLLGTAYACFRRRDLSRGLAAVSGTLLLCDAWFDVLTASTGTDLEIAILLAVLGELPLAGICFLLAIGTTGSLSRANARHAVRRLKLL
jgi:hypothetical protein